MERSINAGSISRQQRRALERVARKPCALAATSQFISELEKKYRTVMTSFLRVIYVVARKAFDKDRSNVKVAALQTHSIAEAALLASEKAKQECGVQTACKAGCTYCCHLEPAVWPLEVINIASYVRETFSLQEQAALRERLEHRFDGDVGTPLYKYLKRPCALLVDGKCSVYPVRPSSCMCWNSLDAEECRRGFESEEREDKPTCFRPQIDMAAVVGVAISLALEKTGHRLERLTLTAGLKIALDHPDSGERWFDGGPVFENARDDHDTANVLRNLGDARRSCRDL